ncbi:MAG: hypothetical protein JSW07_08890, partial [bacterium]
MKEIKENLKSLDAFFEPDEEFNKLQEEFLRIAPVYKDLTIPEELSLNRIQAIFMPPEEFREYVEKLRVFFLEEFEKERVPIGGNKADLSTINKDLWNLIRLNVFDSKVFYEEDGKKILKGYDNCGKKINHWFPEMQDVRLTRNEASYSIIDQLRDKELFYNKAHRIIIKNSLKVYERRNEMIFPKFSDAFRVVAGAQPVTNIRPSVAKWIWL